MASEVTKGSQTREKKDKRDRSQDPLAAVEKRVVLLEIAVGDGQDRFTEISATIEGLEAGLEDLKNGLLGTLNEALDTQHKERVSLEDKLVAVLGKLQEQVNELRGTSSYARRLLVLEAW
ncbi:hypothetical protein AMTR_s00014p00223740 [Amborella trichopoda]|uniref:Uncharacterized protein n=1 Tax=Amborella trichopoda TaxID=13333 RepID=W1PPR1_AMBTC|nr:hypothetical protein AMTR_s00014p00223740 [Amborella trichopoda]